MSDGKKRVLMLFSTPGPVHPGVTMQAVHYVREACVLQRLEIEMPPMFDQVQLVVQPNRHVPLSEPRPSQYGLDVVFWDCAPQLVPADFAIYLRVHRPDGDGEAVTLKAGVWAEVC